MEKINRGWISLEMSFGLILIMLALAGASAMMRQYLDNQEWNAIAQKSTVISDAARRYIADNYPSLLSQAPAGQTLPITVATLINGGYLRPGYSDTNTYGQQYEAVVMKNSKQPDQLDSYVITQRGKPLNDKGRRTVAARINGMGGYTQNNQAVGAFSGWQRPLSQLGLNIPDGHIVVDLTNSVLNTASDESDRLYRYKVNTRPDLNQMHTDIDMGGNALNNASTVTATSDIKSTGGWLVTDNSKGWMNETHGGGFYMDDDSWVKSINGKGIYTAGQLKADGRITAGEYLELKGAAVSGQHCSPEGLVGWSASSGLLTCLNGTWGSISSGMYSRMGVNQLTITSPTTYHLILVTISSKFSGKDGSHTASANFNVLNNGQLVGTVSNAVNVHKGGSSGHSWIYESYAVAQKAFAVPVSGGNQITVAYSSGNYHLGSDIRIDLAN